MAQIRLLELYHCICHEALGNFRQDALTANPAPVLFNTEGIREAAYWISCCGSHFGGAALTKFCVVGSALAKTCRRRQLSMQL